MFEVIFSKLMIYIYPPSFCGTVPFFSIALSIVPGDNRSSIAHMEYYDSGNSRVVVEFMPRRSCNSC
jgi:hypothetical protein